MPDGTLSERLAAVERTLHEADLDQSGATQHADGTIDDRVADLEAGVADLEEGVAELEAAVQAVRGYVGEVRHVNEEVERRADAALAKAETVERMLAPGGPDDHPAPAVDREDAGARPPGGDVGPSAGGDRPSPGDDGSPDGSDGPTDGSDGPTDGDVGPAAVEEGPPGLGGVPADWNVGPVDGAETSSDRGRGGPPDDREASVAHGTHAAPDGDGLLDRVLEVL